MLLYYIPGHNRAPDAATLETMGLSHAFEADGVTPVSVTSGPDGKNGTVVAFSPGEAMAHVGYYPAHQTWTLCGPGDSPWWLGRDVRHPLVPDQLLRKDPVPGSWVTLLDGNEWWVPAMRFLPRSLSRGPDGSWRRRILDANDWIEPLVRDYVDTVALAEAERDPGDNIAVEVSDAWIDGAIRALGINYRITADEVSALELLSDNNVIDILFAVADLDALVKKNEA